MNNTGKLRGKIGREVLGGRGENRRAEYEIPFLAPSMIGEVEGSEAAARIELAHKCFADTRVSTSPRGLISDYFCSDTLYFTITSRKLSLRLKEAACYTACTK